MGGYACVLVLVRSALRSKGAQKDEGGEHAQHALARALAALPAALRAAWAAQALHSPPPCTLHPLCLQQSAPACAPHPGLFAKLCVSMRP